LSQSQQLLLKVEKLTKMSKTSIQMTNFSHMLEEQQPVTLNHTPLSKFEIYEAPLRDKDQLKRVILFSDVPTETTATGQANSGSGGLLQPMNGSEELLLKVCGSEWSPLPFDLTKL